MQAWMQNGRPVRQGGQGVLCNECPCDCPDFDGRIIAYVDKHATGTGDGSSWTDAFTGIQTAIDTYPKREIQIRGYGESDTYPAEIILAECVYLKGVDDMWIDGGESGFGINGQNFDFTKIELLNIKNCSNGITLFSGIITSCISKNNIVGIISCNGATVYNSFFNSNTSSGSANNGVSSITTFDNCEFNDNGADGVSSDNSLFSNCEFNDNSQSGAELVNNIISCVANGNGNHGFFRCGGFFSSGYLTNSTANNNQLCGFYQCVNITVSSESNNCLSGDSVCNPITGSCDTV